MFFCRAKIMTSERNLEYHLVQVGEFGRFQVGLQMVLCLMKIPQQMQVLITYFTSLSPTWICTEHGSLCATNVTYSAENTSRCLLPRHSWEYSTLSSYSIVTDFDLACGQEWLAHLSTTITFVGWTIGSIVFGWVVDNYGRKNILFFSYTFMLSLILLGALSPNVEVFIVSRFFTGFFMGGVYVTVTVMSVEFVGPSCRPISSAVLIIAAIFGNALLCVSAYFIQNWKVLFIVCTCPYYVALVFWKFMPESIKWLQSKGYSLEVTQLLVKIAKTNKKNTKLHQNIPLISDEVVIQERNILALFSKRPMLLRSLSQGYGWFAVVLGYYGLSLASSEFGIGSLYLNFLLATLAEVPGSLFAVYACRRYGRKPATIYPLLASGLCCIILASLQEKGDLEKVRLFIGLLVKLCITTTFDSITTWSIELYPTHLRAIGTGYVQVTGRIGGAVAPWIAKYLGVYSKRAPFIGMAVFLLSSGLFLFILPETKNGLDFTEKTPLVCKSDDIL